MARVLSVTSETRLTLVVHGVEYYRHPVVQPLHELIGLGHDDGATRHSAMRACPHVTQSRQRKGRAILHADTVGNLDSTYLLPFVEAIRRDQAAMAFEGATEGGLAVHCLGPCIDGGITLVIFPGPRWNQPPVRHSR